MFLDLARSRRSVRKYLNTPVEREKILKCLEAARLSPSASNTQPWRYIVVDDPSLKDRVCDAAFAGIFFMNKFAKHAPVMVVVLSEPDLIANRLGKVVQGLLFYLLDVGSSIEHFLLQAAELGLGTCWLGWYSEDRIKKVLNIPRAKKIVSVFCMGYPADEQTEKNRKSLEEISSFNRYKP